MDQGMLVAVGAIVGVVVLTLVLGRAKGGEDAAPRPMPPEDAVSEGASPEPESLEGAPEGDDWDHDEVVAVTSDGYAFLPDTHAVRLLPPHEEGESWKAGESARSSRATAAIAASWHAGDFTGARVARGGGEEPWRLEALGRDGEYTVFGFETRDAAEAALHLFEARDIIRLGLDDEGNPVPPSSEQFDEARRIYDETEQQLAMEHGADEEER